MPEPSEPRRTLGRNFRNWISWIGILLSISAVFAFVLLIAIAQFTGGRNPYVGILAYVVAPLFFILGLILTIVGAIMQRRRERRAIKEEKPLAITIDLSRPRDRRILGIFATASAVFLLMTAVGSYQTYQYTESVGFCGKACHLPMEPEFVTSQHTPHANVECVSCHVGPGAAAYFKTKLNGVNQLYHAVSGDFDRPIYVSEANPRPPQAICEQCHWPSRYVGNVVRSYQHYLSDEQNTPFTVRLLLNVGGGDLSNGPPGGIHWHMNIANKIEYIATDDKRLTIPWVRSTTPDGKVTEYRTADFKDDPAQHKIERMECVDCHSRPAHNIKSPNEAVDLAMSTGRIDPKIPWVKTKVVAALVKPYATKAEAEQGITNALREAYPDPKQADPIIQQTQRIYRANFFPEMKTDWRAHPNFVGHKDSNGCFRCHDGLHMATDGQKSINGTDCRACHLILAQGSEDKLNDINFKGHEFFHVDSEYSQFSCAECHNGGPQQ